MLQCETEKKKRKSKLAHTHDILMFHLGRCVSCCASMRMTRDAIHNSWPSDVFQCDVLLMPGSPETTNNLRWLSSILPREKSVKHSYTRVIRSQKWHNKGNLCNLKYAIMSTKEQGVNIIEPIDRSPVHTFYKCECKVNLNVTAVFSLQMFCKSWTHFNCCKIFVAKFWRKNLYRIRFCRKYEPGLMGNKAFYVLVI